ncbi:nuclear transport factor 2 family protein [Xenophilus arseniciresistens]|uniref:Nuclear transport factor 2 family protein n=1 Tax=Xenophilus arseniciresistens TaxID=1283306 RepID=A0AAE3T1G3_9BURK|nr:nuclear transport factor 2 family protein [Xenophilus arseniciresistens]MDA7419194.1 nuclear transport factor 2 family protein [Xenophilus arseniciresistens]
MTGTDQQRLERLESLVSIRQLKSRYCRYIDTKQWEALRGLFTADARFEGFGSAPDGADVQTFVSGVAARLADAVSVHHCHTPEITLLSEDRARGVWAMQDHLQWPRAIALKEAPHASGFQGFGHYEEEYLREAGQWRMHRLRLTRLRIDPLPAATRFPEPASLRCHDPRWLEALP